MTDLAQTDTAHNMKTSVLYEVIITQGLLSNSSLINKYNGHYKINLNPPESHPKQSTLW